ncbi:MULTISPECIES: alpha/beta fold hydrolase [Pseudarthrobacter]|uniref:Pimeloyl-ACP methyl ester carboxylesterase n=1 Tax=Pseudarthrobacter niigatensis TaxID=369935 RepID=A0AAJ1WHH2_9MICC|nr:MULTISPECIES: alpha/beta fold hydrolase [Pseudarthrobacter]MDQ0146578.1 pimeloyl-ACP methyl ester carboxylesterase [Pseudarthrobacter niigatensis]MDQ0266743.1 pimeloyl-ACP methyl ester carboxylesterase [Pseudarthrobacter niigatensis]QDG61274.1 alpha/beta hydrolase [Pseudarthrobacter sp. NIBRBAC000502771]
MPYEGEVHPQSRRGVSDARLLAEAAALKRFSRRSFLAGAGASGLLAADMLVTREVQSQRRTTRILSVADDFADAYYPDACWFLFPGYKTSWEEAQWILNALRGALNKRARLAAVGYSNLGLDVTEVVRAIAEYVAVEKITKLFFYGHSFGGMLATQVAARLLAVAGIQVQFILLDSSPYSAHDVLDQSWFDGVVFLYESGVRFPSTLRGGYELGERIIHKDERSWRQILNQTLEQLSPIAPSNVLVQTESAYIYHFEGRQFAGQLGTAKMAYLGNPKDATVDYETASETWAVVYKDNMVSSNLQTTGAVPAHASPGWNPQVYRPLVTGLLDEYFPLPRGGSRVSIF